MSILHKLIQSDLGNGFATKNAILETTPYKPEILIIGTFYPPTLFMNANFPGHRLNQYWSSFMNLFEDEFATSHQIKPSAIELCTQKKLTFADFVLNIFPDDNNYEYLPSDYVSYEGHTYNLLQNHSTKTDHGLDQLETLGKLTWNTQNIINYLNQNPQITSIQLSRNPTGIWDEQWKSIVNRENI